MTLRIFLLKCPSSVFTVKCFGASIGGKPLANPAKLCASGLLVFSAAASHPVIQPASWPTSQPASRPAQSAPGAT